MASLTSAGSCSLASMQSFSITSVSMLTSISRIFFLLSMLSILSDGIFLSRTFFSIISGSPSSMNNASKSLCVTSYILRPSTAHVSHSAAAAAGIHLRYRSPASFSSSAYRATWSRFIVPSVTCFAFAAAAFPASRPKTIISQEMSSRSGGFFREYRRLPHLQRAGCRSPS